MLVFVAGAVIVVLALVGVVANADRHERDPHRRGDDERSGAAAAPTAGGSSCGGGGCGGGLRQLAGAADQQAGAP